jgi:predicted DNA-binding protein
LIATLSLVACLFTYACEERAVTVTIELPPEIEAALEALAQAQGLALPQYVKRVLEIQVSVGAERLSPAERAAAWRSSVDGLPLRPPLSDAAISRDGLYHARG